MYPVPASDVCSTRVLFVIASQHVFNNVFARFQICRQWCPHAFSCVVERFLLRWWPYNRFSSGKQHLWLPQKVWLKHPASSILHFRLVAAMGLKPRKVWILSHGNIDSLRVAGHFFHGPPKNVYMSLMKECVVLAVVKNLAGASSNAHV